MNQQRILIVEDDQLTRMLLEIHLQQADYITTGVASGEDALDLFARERFDLLITDLILPNIDGFQVIARARALDPEIAVIIVTGQYNTDSAIAAVNQHVHGYLLKPVHRDNLVRSVVNTLARRRSISELPLSYQRSERAEDHILHIGPLRIDPYRHHVTCSGQPIPLSSGEFALLIYLAQKRGAVVSHQEIAREVLRYPCSYEEACNITRGRIHKLRQKIERTECTPRLIHSIRGTGYRLVEDDELKEA